MIQMLLVQHAHILVEALCCRLSCVNLDFLTSYMTIVPHHMTRDTQCQTWFKSKNKQYYIPLRSGTLVVTYYVPLKSGSVRQNHILHTSKISLQNEGSQAVS